MEKTNSFHQSLRESDQTRAETDPEETLPIRTVQAQGPVEPVTVSELQAHPRSVHRGPAPPAAASWHPQAEVLALGASLFILDPWGLSSPRVQVAGTGGTDGPSAGPSASSHTPVWKALWLGPT